MSNTTPAPKGQPAGLRALFMTEMWERLGFYLMLGILLLYITDTERGGLGFTTKLAAEIYGTYMAFVYFTPFLGGMIADRFLGFRRSVFIGGLLMAGGYFSLGIRSIETFYLGLVLLCLGNGLFKPNISAMVGNLYAPNDPRRDSGFNIFYMGINIGASLSALLSAPLRNLWSFNTAFTAAGVGLLIGVAILTLNWRKLAAADRQSEKSAEDISFGQVMGTIILPAAVFGVLGYFLGGRIPFVASTIGPITFGFIVGMLPVMVYFGLIVKRANAEEKPGLAALIPVFVAGGAFFMVLHLSGGLMTVFAEHNTDRRAEWIPSSMDFYAQKAMPSYYGNADAKLPRPDKQVLLTVTDEGEAMFGARILSQDLVGQLDAAPGVEVLDADTYDVPEDEAFLVCKVFPRDQIAISTGTDAHGVATTSVKVEEGTEPLDEVLLARTIDGTHVPVLLVSKHTQDAVYAKADPGVSPLKPGTYVRLINAEMLTGLLNPLFVVLLTPVVVAFFTWRTRIGKGVTTARKIFWGMIITTAAILVMAFGANLGQDGAAKTSMIWMVLYYAIITVGELCLSPMGLSLVTKLSPKRLVGLMMGGWFLSTAIGNKLSGFISGLEPTTQMFVIIAVAILGVAGFIFLMLPRLDAAIKKYGA
ncbi:MAG TPA: peptide MFS transporter [Candidatus Krumholzibacteria bacterium]|nr:peptide MFS transporter [Candidatus Krumholzibacteria bacterium]HRX50553.1 peptide MFS transporter [Candidatus Krumholzibacteria bacterium]